MKFAVTKEHSIRDIEKFLFPVNQFCQEKIQKGMYDDWNEAAHTEDWLKNVLFSLRNGGEDKLSVYYREENGVVIGALFVLTNSTIMVSAFAKDGIVLDPQTSAHVTCFHVLRAYRGKGLGSAWITGEIFDDLREQGITEVYIKSSHHLALSLYEKLGTKIGNYISVSDSKLYQRYGYIYRIEL